MSSSASAVSSSSIAAAKELAKEALAKAQRAAAITQSINAQLTSMAAAGAAPTPALPPRPAAPPRQASQPSVSLDSQGRLVDERGKVIESTAKPHSTLKINQVERINPLLQSADAAEDVSANKYYDPRMSLPGTGRAARGKRAFQFVAEGTYSKKADDQRAKAAVELMLRDARVKPTAFQKGMAIVGGHKVPRQPISPIFRTPLFPTS